MTAAALARPTAGATAGQRAAALYREARALAEANVSAFAANLEALIAQAAEIADGGDLYPPEVRELCAKLRDQNASRAQALFSGSGHQADAARRCEPCSLFVRRKARLEKNMELKPLAPICGGLADMAVTPMQQLCDTPARRRCPAAFDDIAAASRTVRGIV